MDNSRIVLTVAQKEELDRKLFKRFGYSLAGISHDPERNRWWIGIDSDPSSMISPQSVANFFIQELGCDEVVLEGLEYRYKPIFLVV